MAAPGHRQVSLRIVMGVALAALAAWFALRELSSPTGNRESDHRRETADGDPTNSSPRLQGRPPQADDVKEDAEEDPDADDEEKGDSLRRIGGLVSSPSGDPVEGVRVTWEPPPGTFPVEPRGEARTDAKGAWSLQTSVGPGKGGWLSFERDGYVRLRRPNGPVAPIAEGYITVLYPAATLILRVADAAGSPVESANVEYKAVAGASAFDGIQGETATDDRGESTLVLPAGYEFDVVVSARGYMTETDRVTGGVTHEVRLSASAVIRVRATDSTTGQLLAGSAELYRTEAGRTTWVGSGAIEKGLHVFSRNIGPGTYSASIRKYGWRKESVQIDVREDQRLMEANVLLQVMDGFECVSIRIRAAEQPEASLDGRTLQVFRRPREFSTEEDRWMVWSKQHSFENVVGDRLMLAIRTGDTNDLLIVDGDHDLVAVVGKHVFLGPSEERIADLLPGCSFYFTPSKWGISGAVADLAVTSQRFGPLPLGSMERGSSTFFPNPQQALCQRLGPYPPDAKVTVTPEAGTPLEITVQDAAR